MRKVHIVGGGYEYSRMFVDAGYELVTSVKDAELVCFTGGEDVTPSLYGEVRHPSTYNNPHRDMHEKAIFENCVEHDISMVGICRGGQFLNVMNGGKMWQHVTGHGGNHPILDQFTEKEIIATSTHHQMMRPADDAIIIACAHQRARIEDAHCNIIERSLLDMDYEVLFYEKTRSLCFQPHPEFGSQELKDYFFACVDKHIFGI